MDYHNFSRSLVQVVERDPTLWDNPQRWASLLIKSSLIKAPALLGRMQQLTGHLSATFNSSALRTFWQQHVAKVVPAVAFRSRQVESIINQYIHRRHHLETEGDFRVGEQVFDTCGAHHGNSNTWSTNNSSESLDLLLSALQSPFQLVNEIWSRQLLPRSRVSPARARPRAAHRSLATGLGLVGWPWFWVSVTFLTAFCHFLKIKKRKKSPVAAMSSAASDKYHKGVKEPLP